MEITPGRSDVAPYTNTLKPSDTSMRKDCIGRFAEILRLTQPNFISCSNSLAEVRHMASVEASRRGSAWAFGEL